MANRKPTRAERELQLMALLQQRQTDDLYALYMNTFGRMPPIGSLMSQSIQEILNHEYPLDSPQQT